MRATLIALATSFLLLTGCGQKGLLYIPQDQHTATPAFDDQDSEKNHASADSKPYTQSD
ncbi:MAG: lipoprotein [Pseudomonadales bacterium]